MRRPEATKTARERVRLRIKARLMELGMTGRAFGKAFTANEGKGHVDTWVSSLLRGQFALSLDELDEAAYILKTTAAQLVKSEFDQQEYLTPSEYRIVNSMRKLPPAIRDHFVLLAEYLIGMSPEEADLVLEFRDLNERERASIRHYIRAFRLAREPLPELTVLPGLPESAAPPRGPKPRTRSGFGRKEDGKR